MASRLFIDIDDCLVSYEGGTYQQGAPWEANTHLIQGIKLYRQDHPEAFIVIWSEGGRDYSQMWVDRLLPGLGIVGLRKSHEMAESLIRSQDIVIGSAITPCPATVYGPDEWPL